MVQNVVNYNAVIAVDNPEQKLKPGMTATVSILVAQRQNVLKIPKAALRFQPQLTPKEREQFITVFQKQQMASASNGPGAAPRKAWQTTPKVWTLTSEGALWPIAVRLGINDDQFSELQDGSLQEGQELIIGLKTTDGRGRAAYRLVHLTPATRALLEGKTMTQVLMAIRIAHRALRRNTMRSALTMLGVIIGVAAVIAMLAIGQGAQAAIRAQIASLGSHTLVIQPGSMTQSGMRYGWGSRTTLRMVDVQAILNECPAVAYATPLLRGGFQVVYTNQNWPTTVQGTGIEYPTIREWALAAGEWFSRRRRSTLPAKWRCWGRPCGPSSLAASIL